MNTMQIVRPRLAFDAEFGMHRNWWVRDSRLTGNPISIYLFLLGHEQSYPITQTDARRELGLGERAWVAAKKVLLQAGFLVEVRDRFPAGYVDAQGVPRGGQRRFRLFLQDPEPGEWKQLEQAVLELDVAWEEWSESVSGFTAQGVKTPGQSHPAKCRVAEGDFQDSENVSEKPLVRATLQNAESGKTTLQNAESFIGRENKDGTEGLINHSRPSLPVSKRASDVDAELAKIHESLSVASIERELRGRVDASELDLVAACREILAAAKSGVKYPPAYVAIAIVGAPHRWKRGSTPFLPSPPEGDGDVAASFRQRELEGREACGRGEHDWGPESWGEIARAACVRPSCGIARRSVDAAFAELEDELDPIGGGAAHGARA